MSKIKTMPLGYAVYREDDNPLFGESSTHILIDDEAAGPFIVLKQDTDEGTQELRFDFDEMDILFEIVNKLKQQADYEC